MIADQVSRVYGIASTGNNVFNDQIKAMGAKMTIAIASKSSNTILIIIQISLQ